MSRLAAVLFIVVIFLVGRVRMASRIKQVAEQRDFGFSFLDRLKKYVDSRGTDGESFGWMMLHSGRLQSQCGVFVHYQPPFQRFGGGVFENVPVVSLLPELRRYLGDRDADEMFGTGGAVADIIVNAIVPHLGELEYELSEASAELNNPLRWFREGAATFLNVPVQLLAAFGLLSPAAVRNVGRNRFWSVVQGVVAFTAFVAALATIASGWSALTGSAWKRRSLDELARPTSPTASLVALRTPSPSEMKDERPRVVGDARIGSCYVYEAETYKLLPLPAPYTSLCEGADPCWKQALRFHSRNCPEDIEAVYVKSVWGEREGCLVLLRDHPLFSRANWDGLRRSVLLGPTSESVGCDPSDKGVLQMESLYRHWKETGDTFPRE